MNDKHSKKVLRPTPARELYQDGSHLQLDIRIENMPVSVHSRLMLFGIAILIQVGLPTASGLQCQSVFFGKAVPAKTSPTQPCDEDVCSRTVEDAVPYAVNLFAVYNKGRSPCEISDGAIRVSYPVTDYDDGICKCLVGVLVRRMKQSGSLKDAHGNEVKCDFESLAEHLKQLGDGTSVTEVRRGNSCHCKSRGSDCVENGKTGRPCD